MTKNHKLIPLSVPNFEGNESKYVNEALSAGWVSSGGPFVSKFEEKLGKFLNCEVAACQSGTSALHLAVTAAGINENHMVLVPALTFIAAVNPVAYVNAEPVFIDCDDYLCIDPVKIRSFCQEECVFHNKILMHKKSGKQVKAIVVVHVFGCPADMEAIMNIAEEYNLTVIEDASEALGTCFTSGRFGGCYVGTVGDYGAFSFNGNKIITAGGGGAVTAKSSEKLRYMKYLSTQAKDDQLFYIHDNIGFNYRMTNLQAAVVLGQLEMLSDFIKRKNRNYNLYLEHFKKSELCKLMPFRPNAASNKWFYSLAVDMSKVNCSLREFIDILYGHGIQSRPVWGLICHQKPYNNCIAYKINKATKYVAEIVNLPCSTNLTPADIDYVCAETLNILESMQV